jgi:hypothetical protein
VTGGSQRRAEGSARQERHVAPTREASALDLLRGKLSAQAAAREEALRETVKTAKRAYEDRLRQTYFGF